MDFFPGVGKKGHDCAFFIHTLFLCRVSRRIEILPVGGKADIVELNFIKTSPDQFLGNCRIVLPYVFVVGVYPIFFNRLCCFLNGFIALPRVAAFILYRIRMLPISIELLILEHNDAGNKVDLAFFRLCGKIFKLNKGTHRPHCLYFFILRVVADKTEIIFHIDNECIEFILFKQIEIALQTGGCPCLMRR